jgi:acylpyruvate hydrolase
MRLVTVKRADGTTRAGRIEGDEIALLPFADVGELLESGDASRDAAVEERTPLAGATLGRLVPHPSKVLCIGLNYMDHIREGDPDAKGPAFPETFTKFAESLTGADDDILLPVGSGIADFQEAIAVATKLPILSLPVTSDCVDWEAELVVVIGTPVYRATADEAAAAIAGFTIGNDVSVRDWQMHSSQWIPGKAWKGLSPVGSVLVTADEVGVRPDLQIRCLVDGEVRQDFRTSSIEFGPVELVSYLSRIVPLRPGDLIFTGTGQGVGITKDPQVYLKPGQTMVTELVGITQAVNRLVAEEIPQSGGRADASQPSVLVQDGV